MYSDARKKANASRVKSRGELHLEHSDLLSASPLKLHAILGQGGAQSARTESAKTRAAVYNSGRRLLARHSHRRPKETHSRSTHRNLSVKSNQATMEVEVKIRLPDRASYDKVASLMSTPVATHEQENFFFDGPNNKLGSTKTVLRVRWYNKNDQAVITVKGEQILKDGIAKAPEVEEMLSDPALARSRFLEGEGGGPSSLLSSSPLVASLNEKWRLESLQCIGGFRNLRQEFKWEGETLELDETYFAHGTLWEIEIETSNPEAVREKMEKLLTQHSIAYSYSSTSKFANFIKKTLN